MDSPRRQAPGRPFLAPGPFSSLRQKFCYPYTVSEKLSVAPPTAKQLESFGQYMKRSLHVEHAAVLAGIPSKVLTTWIKLGRAGHRDFVEFVDIIDKACTYRAAELLDSIAQAASDGDVASARWLYTTLHGTRQKKLDERWLQLEEQLDDASSVGAPTEDDLAAAEARLLADEEIH